MKKLRRIIIAGLLVWLPLGITIFIIKILLDLLGQTYLLIPEGLRPENLFGVTIPGFEIIMAIIIPAGLLIFGRAAYHVLLASTEAMVVTLSFSCMRSPTQIVLDAPSMISPSRTELLR